MSFEINWLINERVVYINVAGDIEMHDIQELGHAFKDLYAQGVPPIYVLLDMNKVKRAPISLEQIQKINTDTFRESMAFVLASNSTARFVASLVVQIISRNYQFVDNFDAALAYLYKVEPGLQQLQVNKVA
jgi:hypothetical protein